MELVPHPKRQWVNDRANELEEELILLEGSEFDDAIMGIAEVNHLHVVVYSTSKIIDVLLADGLADGLSIEDAYDHFYFNIAGAYLGPHTPIYVEDPGV